MIDGISRELVIFYVAVLTLGAFAAVSGWRSMKRQIELSPEHSSQWRRWYRVFLIFQAVGVLLLSALMTVGDTKIFSPTLITAVLVLIVILISVPIFVAARYLGPEAKRSLKGRVNVWLLSIALPIVAYLILAGNVDEVTVAVAVLVIALVSIFFLATDLHKRRKD